MTEAAKNFITPLSLEVASRNRVFSNLYNDPMIHRNLPASADILVIAPATANIIGKFARGIADDLLSTSFLSFRGKVVIAPAMNWRMYEKPVFQENLRSLLSHGVIQVGPEKGDLACGEAGTGRVPDIPEIIEAVRKAFSKKDLVKEKILVQAGFINEHLTLCESMSKRAH